MNRFVTAVMGAALIGAPATADGLYGDQRTLAERFAMSGTLGTNGVGLELQAFVNDVVVIRGGASYLAFNFDETYDDIAYAADVDLSTSGVFADLHPFQNSWRLTGGAYFGARDIIGSATPDADVQIGDQTFTPAEVGRLDLDVDLGETAPFLGAGFNNAFTTNNRFSFQTLAGVMFTGSPDVSLAAVGGLLESDPSLTAELAREVESIAEDVENFRYYPVVSFGLNVRF